MEKKEEFEFSSPFKTIRFYLWTVNREIAQNIGAEWNRVSERHEIVKAGDLIFNHNNGNGWFHKARLGEEIGYNVNDYICVLRKDDGAVGKVEEVKTKEVEEKKFTISEIKAWLNGRKLVMTGRHYEACVTLNNSIDATIKELEDYEDGLEAVTERNEMENKGKKKLE